MVFVIGLGRSTPESQSISKFIPLICDFVIKDDLGVASSTLRFDSIEGTAGSEVDLTIDHMSVEPLTGAPAFTVTVEFFRDVVQQAETFVARAFDLQKSRWPHTLDEDVDIKYSMDGARVTVKVLQGMNSFSRVTDYVEIGGVPSLSGSLFMPSNEMRLWSWVTANDAIESMIQFNTPGEANPGGI